MLWLWVAYWNAAALLCGAAAQYSSDECSWRGSGLSHEPHVRDVEQIYLRCAQGSLTWLYPTGAIIVNLRPNTEPSSGGAAGLHACIKPRADSKGAQLYLEQAGGLSVLLGEREQALGAVRCFSLAQGTLFVEAVAHTDISRRITAFQYELVPSQGPGANMYPYLHSGTASCKPCSDEEVLMAVCTSDFAGRGFIRGVVSSPPPSPTSSLGAAGDGHLSAAVSLSRLFHQKSAVFSRSGARGRLWRGQLSVPLQCGAGGAAGGGGGGGGGVYPGGDDEYLLTGSVHFGEAWLGCAPRYKDFLARYQAAQEARINPCQVDLT
ncbi:meteorin-like protein isoform X2 [Gadus morhua]|uniref:meteorin-like protein isoform X2 n=1 Tax=Gadus morhua TaxID=8049 RepID=UPI0011B7CD50|nr:meteorin-like protein isoform X2 [Gadus morhua]